MDRGYADYRRLYKIHTSEVFLITRAKDNMNYMRLCSYPKDIAACVIYDQTIKVSNYYAAKDDPEKMRRIKFKDVTPARY